MDREIFGAVSEIHLICVRNIKTGQVINKELQSKIIIIIYHFLCMGIQLYSTLKSF